MLGQSFMFRKVAIIGVGLIGGSLAKALKKQGLAKEVCGLSRRKESIAAAIKEGAIDHGTHDIKRAVINADLVVLATPVSVVEPMFKLMAPHLKKGSLITDVGSTKVSIVQSAKDNLPASVNFIGSHPLAGSEKKGVEFSSAELFQGATCIITPGEDANRHAEDRIKKLWTALGANIKAMTPEEHDQALAYVSHVPHVVAYSLMQTIPTNFLPYASTGLRDTTRIAGSSPQVWADICLANPGNILEIMDRFVEQFSVVRKAISEGDEKVLISFFKEAQLKREKVSS